MTFLAGAALPAARSTDLVTTRTADSLLVYDQIRHELHTLNPTAATIWEMLDGQRTASDVLIAARADLGSDLSLEDVQLALAALAESNLLAEPVEPDTFTGGGSRRRFLKQAGLVAVPAIVSVTAPMAAAHASTQSCDVGAFTNAECQGLSVAANNSIYLDGNKAALGQPGDVLGHCQKTWPGASTCPICVITGINQANDSKNVPHYGRSVSCSGG